VPTDAGPAAVALGLSGSFRLDHLAAMHTDSLAFGAAVIRHYDLDRYEGLNRMAGACGDA
jgi:hypothetical protein